MEGVIKNKESEKDIDWKESDIDMMLKNLDDAMMIFKIKTNNDKFQSTNTVFVSGYNSTGGMGIGK